MGANVLDELKMDGSKIALVTGAAGTMGRAAARALLTEASRLVLVDIDEKALLEFARELPAQTYPIAFDISDYAQVKASMARVQSEFGDVDILVNNAGVLSKHKALDTTPEEWHRVLRVNLDGAFFLSQMVLPAMKRKRWGRIINVSSFAAKSGGITAGTAYTVSKGGLISLTFALAAETAADGVTVNGIAPAYVKTPMVTAQLTAEERQMVIEKIPVRRYCEPEEFAHVVTFLASPLAGFMTGEIIDLNGGLQFD